MKFRKTIVALLSLILCCGTLLVYSPTVSAAKNIIYVNVDKEKIDYDLPIMVSLGDSYSSGEGNEHFYDYDKPFSERANSSAWLAHRSENSWPGRLVLTAKDGKKIKMSDYRGKNWIFAASSGAVTWNLYDGHEQEKTASQINSLTGNALVDFDIKTQNLAPQLEVFKSLKENSVDYVTMTMGGNDAGFTDVIISALVLRNRYFDPNCFSAFLQSKVNSFNKADGIRSHLETAYGRIAEAAGSQAHIIIAGYPNLLESTGKTKIFSEYEAKEIEKAVNFFNSGISNLVDILFNRGMRIYFVSVMDEKSKKNFCGHEAFSEEPYINKLMFRQNEDIDQLNPVSAYSMHPNEEGIKVYAYCVQEKIKWLEAGNGEPPESPSRAKPTEKPTDKAVKIPTHKPTEAKVPEYTAVKLASKNLNEIKNILGNDYTSEHIQLSNAFSSSGTPYIYNYDVLPGLAFATGNDDYYGISIMDGAYLNDKISSDMKYNQIADIIGDNEGFRAGQGNNIAFGVTIDGYEVTFCFIENDYIRNHNSDATVPSSVLRAGNPSLQSIGLRREPTVKPTEKPTEAPTPTKANSDSSYSSYLGTWEYVNNASGIPDDPYAVVTSVTFNEINGSTANITIFKGNLAKVCQIDVTAEIIDGKIDFSYDKDGWENSGHGTITLNEDSIHLYAEVDSYGPNARMGLSCDDTLYRS